MGKRLCETWNGELMLLVFLILGVGVTGWLYFTLDATSRYPSHLGRTVWLTFTALGVAFGIWIRLII